MNHQVAVTKVARYSAVNHLLVPVTSQNANFIFHRRCQEKCFHYKRTIEDFFERLNKFSALTSDVEKESMKNHSRFYES